MYLHDDRELFAEIIYQVEDFTGRAAAIVEKDYYVTLILRFLAHNLSNIVFKGGTSLSKGYRAINRFSEDIDITFDEHIGQARRKKLKNNYIKEISEKLNMPIANWNETQSDRDYNAYFFTYKSIRGLDERILDSVKLETALGSYAFPTETVKIGNYIGEFLKAKGRYDLEKRFFLDEFDMKLQTIDRTFIDKIFALCDYYLQRKSKRYSRHLYDIYKLSDKINFNEQFEMLFRDVRLHRKMMTICPSAKDGVNLPEVIRGFCHDDFYREDYNMITSYFADDHVMYDDCIEKMMEIANIIEEYNAHV